MENIIIIGSGPAGWTAGIYAARASLAPLLIEGAFTAENQELGTLPMGQLSLSSEVENFSGFPFGSIQAYLDSAIAHNRKDLLPPREENAQGISGAELVELMRTQAVHFGTRVVSDDVVDVDFTGSVHKLIGSNGNVYETKAVVIATGARANYLGLSSETKYKNRGVSACATCDGALPRFRNKPIAVIGGGDAAVEEAEYLTKTASVVYLIHRRDQLRASKIVAQRALHHPKIKILWNRLTKEIIGNDNDGVTGILLQSTAGESDLTLDVSGVFAAIGRTPNSGFLKGKLELSSGGYIIRTVPFRTNTSVSGVFVAGDVADEHYRQGIAAAGSGCMAAIDAERYLSCPDARLLSETKTQTH
ncbi:MAG: FAD-dependent oxidoreductase [Planctomycetaceae bacterium]|jgi:thioredoxin reductase (NADPH)|nr:FAD-dependent oxidoreductase [Planctomycetaceae bacterium]